MIIYLVRHGETVMNKKGIVQGHKDSSLTSKGVENAEGIGKRLSKQRIEVIFSSDLERCVQTAEIINKFVNKDLIKIGELRERNFGVLNGQPEERVLKELDLSNPDEVAPNGESFNQMKKRVLGFIKVLGGKDFKQMLVVTHEGPLRAILSEYYKVNFDSEKCDNSSENIYRIEVENGKMKSVESVS